MLAACAGLGIINRVLKLLNRLHQAIASLAEVRLDGFKLLHETQPFKQLQKVFGDLHL